MRVHPGALAPLGHPLAGNQGTVERALHRRPPYREDLHPGHSGAGAGPTAAAVAADIADIMTDDDASGLSAPAERVLKAFGIVDAAHTVGKAYADD